MEYRKIDKYKRSFICKNTYKQLSRDKREIYYNAIKKAVNDMGTTNQHSIEFGDYIGHLNIDLTDRSSNSEDGFSDISGQLADTDLTKILSDNIYIIGMEYFGNHCFSHGDNIFFQREDDNPVDPDTIKVMVKKEESWVHVAYVSPDSAKYLRTINEFDKKTIKFCGNNGCSSVLRVEF